MRENFWRGGAAGALGLLLLVGAWLVGCAPVAPAEPTLCPQATPEHLQVDPVTSPTDQLSQVVTVHMGNLDVVTISTESGVFTGTGSPAQVDVTLLPDTVHHLHVEARVKETWQGGCPYGGYTLQTTRDRAGDLLVIEQGQPGPPRPSGAVIGPENALQLAQLFSLTPDARLATDFSFRGNQELISVGYAEKIFRWNLSTGEEIDPLGEGLPEAEALCVAASAEGKLVATGGTADDPSVRLWDVDTGETTLLGRHTSLLSAVAFDASGARLVSGDRADTFRVWDVASRQEVAVFQGDVPKRAQAFSGFHWLGADTLIAGASDAIYWWDVEGRRLLERIARPSQAAFLVEVAFSPDGRRLAAVAQDGYVYLWSRDAGWVAWPAEPGAQLSHVAFSPDGRLVAATSFEGELVLWESATGERLVTLPVSLGDIAALQFSPDGRTLAVGGWDSPIGLWGVP
jgi:WD40 repeat protein